MNRFFYTFFFIIFTNVLFSQPAFTVKNYSVEQGKPVCCDIVVSGFKDILTAQFTFAWDPAVIKFDSVNNFKLQGLTGNNIGTSKTAQGLLSFSWFDVNASGKSLNDGDVLFTVCYTAVGSAGDESPLWFAGSPIKTEVTDIYSNGEDIGAVTTDGSVKIIEQQAAISFQKISLESGSSGCNLLSANGIDAVKNLEGTINWDPAVVAFDSLCCLHPQLSKQYFNELLASSGKILLDYDNAVPIDTKTSPVIAGFCFTAIALPGSSTNITLDGSYFPLNVKNGTNKPLSINEGVISIDLQAYRVILPDVVTKQGETMTVPLLAGVSGKLNAFSGNICFPAQELQYNLVYKSKIAGLTLDPPVTTNNITNISWNWTDASNATYFAKNDTIISIMLKANGPKSSKHNVSLCTGKYPLQATVDINKSYDLNVVTDTGSVFILPDNVRMQMNDSTGKLNEIVCVPVHVRDFKNIRAFEMVFKSDPAIAQPIEIKNKLIPLTPAPQFTVLSDVLSVKWQGVTNNDLLSLVDDAVIVELCYQLIGSVGSITQIATDTSSFYLLGETGSKHFAFEGDTALLTVESGLTVLSVTSTVVDNNCQGEENGNILLNIKGGKLPYKFLWSNGSVTQNISHLADGFYSVTIMDASVPAQVLHQDFSITHLHQNPSFTDIATQQIDCPGGSVHVQADNPTLFYTWSGNGLLKNGVTSVEISEAGFYTVKGMDQTTSCSVADTFEVKDAPVLEDAFVTESFLYACDNVLLEAVQSPGVTGYWTGAGGNIVSPNQHSTLVEELTPGLQYFVWTISSAACTDYSNDTIWVFVKFPVEANDDVLKKDVKYYNIIANDAINPGQVKLTIHSSLPQGMTIDSFGNLSILPDFSAWDVSVSYTICDPVCTDNCSQGQISFVKDIPDDKDTTVVDPEVPGAKAYILPNAISPNNDGSNDYLFFDEISNGQLVRAHLLVFDRAGRPVFESKDYKNNWSGKHSDGSDLPVDTYYYVLYIDLQKGKYVKGPVTILK
ncbi:MAG TPA: gliding motility-associated C-terminal domain-containing protein [Saprospiraceae bacterium]|nr:gliding motility-associated C-terminal domain-containing protein [Saprospiraceae bacterium]